MTSIEFNGKTLSLTSPGLFYGGVTIDNIAFHDPRHRNKALARLLMNYRFMDRAGMGILRMGVKSLMYGRSFPVFEEIHESVKVSMQAEYIRPSIFMLTHGKQSLYLHDLILLNKLYGRGFIPVQECFDLIKKVIQDQWKGVQEFVLRWENYVELCGSKSEVNLTVKSDVKKFFNVTKTISNSFKQR